MNNVMDVQPAFDSAGLPDILKRCLRGAPQLDLSAVEERADAATIEATIAAACAERAEPQTYLLRAVLLLWQGGDHADEAHRIVQAHEGDPNADLIHAIYHRREGDAANAEYWIASCGEQLPAAELLQHAASSGLRVTTVRELFTACAPVAHPVADDDLRRRHGAAESRWLAGLLWEKSCSVLFPRRRSGMRA